MKIVLIILLNLINLAAFSQITLNQGKWCINKYDENFKLKQIIVVQDSLLIKDSLEFIRYKKIIEIYQNDSISYTKIIKNDSIIFDKKDKIIVNQSDEILKQKNKGIVKSGIIILLLLITLIK